MTLALFHRGVKSDLFFGERRVETRLSRDIERRDKDRENRIKLKSSVSLSLTGLCQLKHSSKSKMFNCTLRAWIWTKVM